MTKKEEKAFLEETVCKLHDKWILKLDEKYDKL